MSEYGKFTSAEELLKGYEELEKSYTQKCQKLSALEKEISSGINGNPSPLTDGGQSAAEITTTVPVRENDGAVSSGDSRRPPAEPTSEQIKQYLDSHKEYAVELLVNERMRTKSGAAERSESGDAERKGGVDTASDKNAFVRLIDGGGNPSMALPNKPRTLKEASELAKNLFK